MKTAFIYGTKAKFIVLVTENCGQYATDFLSLKKAKKHAENLKLLGFNNVEIIKKGV